MRPVCAGWVWGQGRAEDPVRRVQAAPRVQAPGRALGAPKGEEVTSTPNDQVGCSVRPGATYERVWRCSPTAAPQCSPGHRPCTHGWAPCTPLTLLSMAHSHLPEGWHETVLPSTVPPGSSTQPWKWGTRVCRNRERDRDPGVTRDTAEHEALPEVWIQPPLGR